MIPDTTSSAASGMGLVEELRAWADRIAPLGWADVGRERILRAAAALSAKDRELAEARAEYDKLLSSWAESRERHLAAERARDEALSALRECQSTLAMLIEPKQISGTTIMAAFAAATAAEARASSVLTPVSREQRGNEEG